jgi:protein-S-isoprenylcysteine O-methyltransferase Ste14
MNQETSSYGLWGLVILNSALFIFFAFTFFKPATKRDWRTFSSFSAFIVALFVEMYGFPLTIYLLAGWLQTKFPETDFFAHENGHLWAAFLSIEGDAHFHPIHIASHVFIIGGFVLLSASWRVLYRAQKAQELATTGPYGRVRHPQYIAFVAVMFGFLLQWPTILTLAMFPVLVFMYARLSRREEREMAAQFGDVWRAYVNQTRAFIPRLHTLTSREA